MAKRNLPDEPAGVGGRSTSAAESPRQDEPAGVDGRSTSAAESPRQDERRELWEADCVKASRRANAFNPSLNSLTSSQGTQNLAKNVSTFVYGERHHKVADVKIHYVPEANPCTCAICLEPSTSICVPLAKRGMFYEQVCAHPEVVCHKCFRQLDTCPFCRKPFSSFAVFKSVRQSGHLRLAHVKSKCFRVNSSRRAVMLATKEGYSFLRINNNRRLNSLNKAELKEYHANCNYFALLACEDINAVETQTNLMLWKVSLRRKIERVEAFASNVFDRTDTPFRPIPNLTEIKTICIQLDEIIAFAREKIEKFDKANMVEWRDLFPTMWRKLEVIQDIIDKVAFLEQNNAFETIDLTNE